MILGDFIRHANEMSDESESPETITGFLNDGLAKINAECKAAYPFMNPVDLEAQIPIPETWVRVMLLPFAAGRIKTKDSSQFEYSDLYAEFQRGLEIFKSNYTVPEDLRDRSGQVFDPITGQWVSNASDIYSVRPMGWMGW